MTLPESATVLAAAGALVGGVVVWANFVAERRDALQELDDGVHNLIKGLETELELLKGWASAEDGEIGYPMHGDEYETHIYYWNEGTQEGKGTDLLAGRHWRNPMRIIHAPQIPTIEGVVTSPYARYLGPDGVPAFVGVTFAYRAMFTVHDEYRRFVLSQPQMFAAIVKANADADPTVKQVVPEGAHDFIRQVFEYNYHIHVHRIGSINSEDAGCLRVAYLRAKAALDDWKRDWKRPRLGGAFFLGHVAAGLFGIIGILLLLYWCEETWLWDALLTLPGK